MIDQNYYKHLQVWCTMKLHMKNASNIRLSWVFCLKGKGPGAIIFQNVNVIKDKSKAWTVFQIWRSLKCMKYRVAYLSIWYWREMKHDWGYEVADYKNSIWWYMSVGERKPSRNMFKVFNFTMQKCIEIDNYIIYFHNYMKYFHSSEIYVESHE